MPMLVFCLAVASLFVYTDNSVLPGHFGEFLKSKQLTLNQSCRPRLHKNTCKEIQVLPPLKRCCSRPVEEACRLSGNLLFV